MLAANVSDSLIALHVHRQTSHNVDWSANVIQADAFEAFVDSSTQAEMLHSKRTEHLH